MILHGFYGFYGFAIGGISRVCLSFQAKASILLLFLQHLILFWSLLTSSRPAALRSSVLSTRAVGPKPQPHSSSEQSLLQAFWLDLDGFGPFGSWSKWTKGRCHSKKLSHATSADLIEDTYSYFVPIRNNNFRYIYSWKGSNVWETQTLRSLNFFFHSNLFFYLHFSSPECRCSVSRLMPGNEIGALDCFAGGVIGRSRCEKS